ncbi:polyphosphate kinase 1 [Ascidiimonas aurantiaca]|uniref:polyphosphate kinase 1 n=1 Tax=Ascidiimonas aurantiaca TaxID=1685432 RepID=UPI0030EB435C
MERFISRERSWLAFNARVLQEATDERNPLFERLKFLAIFSSNLDEFFKVKVSQLRQIKKVDKPLRKRLILKPNKKLKALIAEVEQQQQEFGRIFFEELLPQLSKEGIELVDKSSFSETQRIYGTLYFRYHLKNSINVVKPQTGKKVFLEDGDLYLAVMHDNKLIFVSIPVSSGRFIALPAAKGTHAITFVEELIKDNLEEILPGLTKKESFEIKLSRDAELYLEDDFDGDLAQQIYENLGQRKEGQATRLLYDMRMPEKMRERLKKILGLGKADMVPGGKYHNFSDLLSLKDPTGNAKLHFESQKALPHPVLQRNEDYFEHIREKDQIVHFPYQSFDILQGFLETCASDPQVTSISISLYRIAKESELTNALLRALRNRKRVMIFMETQARFDEANNYEWGKRFENEGAFVYYSIRGLKVHSKILQVTRKEGSGSRKYSFISTGNFNAETARIYTDHGLFTANQAINSDISLVFDYLEGNRASVTPATVLVSPFTTRVTFENLIDQEITNARKGKPSGITAKMNALEDKKLIEQLYKASEAGVPVRLLVRGFCCLISQRKGLSDHIKVTSIVDRYLEHGRIYIFENAGNQKMYIGSADWMPRNLDKRIEVLAPILDKEVFTELYHLLQLQLNDTVKARHIEEEHKNEYVRSSGIGTPLRSQYAQFDYLTSLLSKKANKVYR